MSIKVVRITMTAKQYVDALKKAKYVFAWVIAGPDGSIRIPITKKAACELLLASDKIYAQAIGKSLYVGSSAMQATVCAKYEGSLAEALR